MAITYDGVAANAALKELYDDQYVETLIYRKNPAMALMEKSTDFGGKYKPIPIITGAGQGRSSTFSTAQTNQTAAQVQSFLLTSKNDYQVASIDQRTMLAAKTDKMAFLETAKTVIDTSIRNLTNSIASAMYRAGTGTIGQVSTATSISTGVITLQSAADVVQFEINQTLQANATDGGTPRSALGYVIAVDRSAGTVTVASSGLGGSAGTPSSWSTSDYLLVQGDVNAKPSGFQAWMPATAPSASTDNFYGVNRGYEPWRLGGGRYNGGSQSIEEAIIDASMLLGREDGMPDYFFTNYASYGSVTKALGAKVQYVDLTGPAEIAFRGIRIHGADGEIKMMPDRNCPALSGFLLTMNTWKLEGLNVTPHISRYGDGLEMLRLASQDANEVRISAYYNIRTNAPGWNCQVTLAQ